MTAECRHINYTFVYYVWQQMLHIYYKQLHKIQNKTEYTNSNGGNGQSRFTWKTVVKMVSVSD